MFDISFSELMLIGVIALIVIGPERLPKVARTVGHLLGRAQRYVNDVKTDIRKEMDSTEIGNLKDQMQEAASSVKSSVKDAGKSWQAPFTEAQDALKQASDSVKTLAESARNLDDTASQPDQGDLAQTESTDPAPAAISDDTPEQDLQDAAIVDDRTLPLPGFAPKPELEPAIAPDTSTDSTQATKGTQP